MHKHTNTSQLYATSDFRFSTFTKCEQNANNDYKEVEKREAKKKRGKIAEFTGNYCAPMKRRRKGTENE